jgi:soluble cytochrome b562
LLAGSLLFTLKATGNGETAEEAAAGGAVDGYNVPEGGPGENALYDNMMAMQEAYRALGLGLRRAGAEDIPELWAACQRMQELTLEAKAMVPVKIREIAEAEREAFVTAYRLKQVEVIRTLLEIEAALLVGNLEQAAETFRDLRTHKTEGHEQFQN